MPEMTVPLAGAAFAVAAGAAAAGGAGAGGAAGGADDVAAELLDVVPEVLDVLEPMLEFELPVLTIEVVPEAGTTAEPEVPENAFAPPDPQPTMDVIMKAAALKLTNTLEVEST